VAVVAYQRQVTDTLMDIKIVVGMDSTERDKPYALHQDRYPSKNCCSLLGELFEEWQSK
jgi:hypothetical protein